MKNAVKDVSMHIVCPKGIVVIKEDKLNTKGHHPAGVNEMEKCIGCAFVLPYVRLCNRGRKIRGTMIEWKKVLMKGMR